MKTAIGMPHSTPLFAHSHLQSQAAIRHYRCSLRYSEDLWTGEGGKLGRDPPHLRSAQKHRAHRGSFARSFVSLVFPAGCAGEEGVQRGRLLPEGDECEGLACARAALRVVAEVGVVGGIDRSQWTLATQLAVQLNDYSSIIIIMDSVGNDVPGIRVGLRSHAHF